ncbi:ABC transporter permease [Phototrophicus methaneseepsis]|uniref:ABC transporter permease n=1 Tax=Phototrophicus methaneseepsis TaxID=2710758 RepID=A0A7S8IDA0_9CHLR|nr:ABC transporter permease [Phototrophicus methaneseepsis]QPC81331.1 ABC transporter permease [Phototrophicus methaneseepsis]
MNYRYILQRLFLAVVVILGVTFVVFMIVQIVPGDPARVVLGPYASDESVAGLRERLGLNRPFFEQYFTWLGGIVQGDFGQSLLNGQDVATQLLGRVGPSLELAFVSLFIGLAIAFPIGIISAIRPGSAIDIVATLFSQIGVSVPTFWMGILLMIFFSLTLGVLPPGGYTPFSEDPGDWLAHIILPAFTAGFVSASIQTRFIRSAMLDILNANFIQTARAKGLSERAVIIRHAMRNAMINIVTIIGLQITALFSGLVIVEVVFSWPGLGRLALNAVLERDYPMLQGAVFVVALVVTIVNLLIDLLYFVLDPRIEYA